MKKIQIHKVIFTVFLFAIGFTMLTPLLWMISTSFKPENEVFQFPIKAVDNFAPGCYPFFILTMENSYDQDDII